MVPRPKRYPKDQRDRAVCMVLDRLDEYPSLCAAGDARGLRVRISREFRPCEIRSVILEKRMRSFAKCRSTPLHRNCPGPSPAIPGHPGHRQTLHAPWEIKIRENRGEELLAAVFVISLEKYGSTQRRNRTQRKGGRHATVRARTEIA
jgi:hypothetical protein